MTERKPIYRATGVSSALEVFEDKLEIKRSGLTSMIIHGLHGTKTIPFRSITAIQFKESGMVSGYLQFTLVGGRESTGGVLAAAEDENSFMFRGQNKLMRDIKDYIEQQRALLHAAPAVSAPSGSIADEIAKLKALHDQGVLTASEFDKAKSRLLGTD